MAKRKGAKSPKRKPTKPAPKKRAKVKAKKKGAKSRAKPERPTKRAKAKKRDYRAEYRARLKRALDQGYSRAAARGHVGEGKVGLRLARKFGIRPGSDLKAVIELDRSFAFGGLDRAPRLTPGEGGVPGFALIAQEKIQREGFFAWDSESDIIAQFTALGMTEREAYTTWVSP